MALAAPISLQVLEITGFDADNPCGAPASNSAEFVKRLELL
jgi:hypothetical protein